MSRFLFNGTAVIGLLLMGSAARAQTIWLTPAQTVNPGAYSYSASSGGFAVPAGFGPLSYRSAAPGTRFRDASVVYTRGSLGTGCLGVGCLGAGSCFGSTLGAGAGCFGTTRYGAGCHGAGCAGYSAALAGMEEQIRSMRMRTAQVEGALALPRMVFPEQLKVPPKEKKPSQPPAGDSSSAGDLASRIDWWSRHETAAGAAKPDARKTAQPGLVPAIKLAPGGESPSASATSPDLRGSEDD